MAQPQDWSAWMRQLGHRVRQMREFLGFSQDHLARLAGVSQGAISRLEAGRAIATPLLMAVKVQAVLVSALREIDPAILSDELRAIVEAGVVSFPVNGTPSLDTLTGDRGLDELIRLYRALPERQREQAVMVFRAAAEALVRVEEKDGK